MRAEYLAMRRAVLRFARTLNQLEGERLDRVDAMRPAGAPSMRELNALIERDAALALEEQPMFPAAHCGTRSAREAQ